MEDLHQSQIRDSCRLALPEGLKDLMCDISREVLRAQPADVYRFITDYLSALLLTRDTLSLACKICNDVCKCSCRPELDQELRLMGLDGDELDFVKNIVLEYLDKGEANETNLFMRLLRHTSIDENRLQAIQEAVRRAFLRNQTDHPKKYEMPLPVEAQEAADHTLRIYESVENIKDRMATKIQALFRGYLVRKESKLSDQQIMKKKVMVDNPKKYRCTESSQSLAGSFLKLPKYVPYSAHAQIINEIRDQEWHSEYSEENSPRDVELSVNGKKKTSFQKESPVEEFMSCSKTINDPQTFRDEDDGDSENSDASVEEQIVEYNTFQYNDVAEVIEELEVDREDKLKGAEDDQRQLVEEIQYECFLEEEKDYLREHEIIYANDNEDPDDLIDVLANIQELQKQDKSRDDTVLYKVSARNEESLTSLSFDQRDHSIMIKPVKEHIDLHFASQKCLQEDIITSDLESLKDNAMEKCSETIFDIPEKIIRERRYTDF